MAAKSKSLRSYVTTGKGAKGAPKGRPAYIDPSGVTPIKVSRPEKMVRKGK